MHLFWITVARLGEAQILLPALLAVALWRGWHAAPREAWVWLAPIGVGALLTAATKVAFIGWGIGFAPLDFTGISGHAMFAAAIVPLLARAAGGALPGANAAWIAGAYALAGLVATAQVVLGRHSVSEVLAGLALGATASALASGFASVPSSRAPRALLVALLAWLLVTPAGAPASPTHGWVVRLALELSGRPAPYTREMMLAEWHARQRRGLQPG